MSFIFFRCKKIKEIPNIALWDTSSLQDLESVASIILECPSSSFVTEIHTQSSGNNDHNIEYISFTQNYLNDVNNSLEFCEINSNRVFENNINEEYY